MTSSITSSTLTPAQFQSSLKSEILKGASGTSTATTGAVTDAATLKESIASGILSGTASENLTYTSLAGNSTSSAEFTNALNNALLGGNSDGDTVANLAALGSTLNSMAETAQAALTATNATDRQTALTTYQNLYNSLNSAEVSINGTAGNAVSLGISSPGNWANSNLAVGTTAILADMTSVVKAHATIQGMIQSVAATRFESLLV
jgi:hypothetical protein